MSPTLTRSLRLAMAAYIATALVGQIAILVSEGTFVWHRFFSYFTVLSNIAAVVVLTMLALRPDRDAGPGFALFRGAVTVYMSVTFLIYVTVLYPQLVDVGVPEPWIDVALHVLGPIFIIVDWLVNRPGPKLESGALGIWMIFPAVYLVYTLIRGPLVDWYPYPIFDPDEQGGYGGVAAWVLIVAAVLVGFSLTYRWWANRRRTGLHAA